MAQVDYLGTSHPTTPAVVHTPAATSSPVVVPKFVIPSGIAAAKIPNMGAPMTATQPPPSSFFSKQLDNVEGLLSRVVNVVDKVAETSLNTFDRVVGINHEYSDAVDNPHIRRAALLAGGGVLAADELKKRRGKGRSAGSNTRVNEETSYGGRSF